MADLTITAANVAKGTNAQIETVTGGATITAGQAVYKDVTDNEWKLADADDTEETAGKDGLGVSLNDCADGQPLAIIKGGNYNPGATVSVGERYYVSGTAGGIAPSADLASGDYVSMIGYATTTSNISVQALVTGVQIP